MPTFTLNRSRALVVAGAALAVVFGAAHFLGGSSAPAHVTVEGSGSGSGSGIVAVRRPVAHAAVPALVVDVAGAVRRPGLYRLPQGSRIADALARAGGETKHADTLLVNLAAPLVDGEQVLVPSIAEPGASVGAEAAPGAPGATGGAAPSPTAPVDLNTATAEQLDALPGVGPVTAQKIIDYRQAHGPYTSVDQLDAISGIGPARIADLKGLVQP